MVNLELKLRITKVNLDIIDINGFKYNLHTMEVGTLKDFKVLIPIFDSIQVGDCIYTDNWIVTRIGQETQPVDLCIRLDKYTLMPSEGFEVSKYLNSKVTGLFFNSEKCFLRTVGPDRKPFYMATLKLKDSYDINYEMLIVAFGDKAKRLSTVKKLSILDCEVTVKKKKEVDGYELAVTNFDVVNTKNKNKNKEN